MMGSKERHFAPLINVSLEDLVPTDHFYRHLERTLDLSFVREFVQETYASGGRPSIDPIVFFKLQLVMFFEGIRSERLLMRHADDRLSVRWYLGYDLDEPLPDHSSLTRIRTRYGVEMFRRFFEVIVDQCQQAGLVWGKELYADATKVQANAALSSMKPRFAVEAHLASLFAQEADEHEETKEETIQHDTGVEQEVADVRLDPPAARLPSTTPEGVDELVEPSPPRQLPPVLDEALQEELTTLNSQRHDWIERLGEPDRSLRRGTYRRMADFWVSTTDPDATMMNSKGEGTRLGYHTHYVVDGGKARIIMAVLVTPSEVMENQPVLDLLWRVRFRWKLWPRQFTGDTTYGTAEIITALEQQQIRPYVPLPDFDQRSEFFGQRDFHYDAEHDRYLCPNGAELRLLPSGCTDQFKQYRAKASVCNACPLKSRCTTSKTGRRLSRHVAEEAFERVRAFHQTEAYKKAINKRKVWVEPLFAEAKDWHGMRRFRLRLLWRVNIEALLCAAGQNLKRLLKKRGWGRRPFPAEALSAHFLALCGLVVLVCKLLTAWLDTDREGHFEGRCSLASYGLALQEGVFQHSVLLYGTVSQKGRSQVSTSCLHWPIFLPLLLDTFLSSFSSYMVLGIRREDIDYARPVRDSNRRCRPCLCRQPSSAFRSPQHRQILRS